MLHSCNSYYSIVSIRAVKTPKKNLKFLFPYSLLTKLFFLCLQLLTKLFFLCLQLNTESLVVWQMHFKGRWVFFMGWFISMNQPLYWQANKRWPLMTISVLGWRDEFKEFFHSCPVLCLSVSKVTYHRLCQCSMKEGDAAAKNLQVILLWSPQG